MGYTVGLHRITDGDLLNGGTICRLAYVFHLLIRNVIAL
jgi:hypothetical protein